LINIKISDVITQQLKVVSEYYKLLFFTLECPCIYYGLGI